METIQCHTQESTTPISLLYYDIFTAHSSFSFSSSFVLSAHSISHSIWARINDFWLGKREIFIRLLRWLLLVSFAFVLCYSFRWMCFAQRFVSSTEINRWQQDGAARYQQYGNIKTTSTKPNTTLRHFWSRYELARHSVSIRQAARIEFSSRQNLPQKWVSYNLKANLFFLSCGLSAHAHSPICHSLVLFLEARHTHDTQHSAHGTRCKILVLSTTTKKKAE